MIFSGGMIPEYLVMKRLGLVDNMWILVVGPYEELLRRHPGHTV